MVVIDWLCLNSLPRVYPLTSYTVRECLTNYICIMNKKTIKKYADLMHQAQQSTGRKEGVGLIHKAAKLKTKFNNYEIM